MLFTARVLEKLQFEARKFSPRWALRLKRFESVESVQLRLMREAYPEDVGGTHPLVSVIVPTYNRASLLLERAVRSIQDQSYSNWEMIIVGDHCTDDTGLRLRSVGDARIRFLNLSHRHQYPASGRKRWAVAGSVPINRALMEARGDWIVYSDDDVVSVPDRIALGLEVARETGAELVYGRTEREHEDGVWRTITDVGFANPRMPYRRPPVTHVAFMYRSYLRTFLYDSESYRDNITTDRDRNYRLARAGVRTAPVDSVLVRVPRTRSASAAAE